MRRITASLIISVLVLGSLTACTGDVAPEKSSFGQVDPMADSRVLVGSVLDEDDADKDGAAEEAADVPDSHAAHSGKTSEELDVANLPPSIKRMAQLCDAVNLGTVETLTAYSSTSASLIWHCIHLYICNCTDEELGVTTVGDYYEADPRVVTASIYAMFGKIKDIPRIPTDETISHDGEAPHIQISNDMKYRFLAEDRGPTVSEIRRATLYSDGSLEMEVALMDSETGEETVSIIYTMRVNSRDTTTSAMYEYEITGSRAADSITSDKISGTPFISIARQVYGYDLYPEDDSRYNEVEEVLEFSSFKEHVPGLNDLNKRITEEIIPVADEELDEVSWHEIKSYPITTEDHVQIATTYITYPNYGTDPDVACFIFDKKKKRAMVMNDVLEMCALNEFALTARVRGLWNPEGDETLTDLTYRGFIIRRDGSADIFYMLDIHNPEAGDYRRIGAYNSKAKKLRYPFDEGDLLPEDETDQMKPALTHGVKEQ
ncbi:MAG: hypothetical protein K6E49_03780 [Lachnospiraceae bacterium]|nr:hypothetical protein [Lachnospiraceae bacterium]